VSFLTKGDGGRVMSTCLSAYFHYPHNVADSFFERLSNAVTLLAHADQAGAAPISLSLSFAAIEAIVCEEELPVTRQIKKHVSTLLVPDAARRKKRETTLEDLYRIRCKVLHGSRVDASRTALETVRRIAAGVIRAVTCWRKTVFAQDWKHPGKNC
jgi:hypothetical protein